MVEPPYGIIWNLWKTGNVIPFFGAGASFVSRPPEEKWDPVRPTFLPSGQELAHFLADEATFPSTDPRDRDDLAKVSSYYVEAGGRPRLRSRMRQILYRNYQDQEFQPGALHHFIASIPANQLIVAKKDPLYKQYGRKREKWISELQAGRNPFDPATLKALRNE